ncbi:MAG: hypothetical protein ACSHX6_09780 [Akkermansiaceae bacterium]
MTDGQTFYLILLGFYLTTGLKTGSKDAFILRNKFSFKKGWSLGHPFAFLGGTQKSVFFSHISPIYSYSIVANQDNNDAKILPPRHVKRIIRIIANAASRIRFLSFIVFYLYCIIVPVVYFQHGDTPITYIAILIALLFPIFPTICFFFTHKKISPNESNVRWKNSFYAIFMPWHAMRLADFLFQNPHLSQIHPLSYANITTGEASQTYLSQQYRNTLHRTTSLYTKQEFQQFFQNSDLTPQDFTTPPTPEDPTEQQYCPCCHSFFTDQTNHCTDCENLPLVKIQEI